MKRTAQPQSVTVLLAGTACRLRSTWLKPLRWARELHPHFVTTRSQSVDVRFVFDQAYWSRPLPWIGPNTVRDEPIVTTRGGQTTMTSSFYRARWRRHSRVQVTLAAGFQVDAVLRALCALSVQRRGGVLVGATRVADGAHGALVFGSDGDDSTRAGSPVFSGFVAVVPGVGYRLHVTPFGADADVRPDDGVRARALYVVRPAAPEPCRRLSSALAVAMLAPHVVSVGRTAATLGRLARLAASLPCYVVRAVPPAAEWSARNAA